MHSRAVRGAYCIAPSISSLLQGLLQGKTAGTRYTHLACDHRCALFGKPARQDVYNQLQPSEEMCEHSTREAFVRLAPLEWATRPG